MDLTEVIQLINHNNSWEHPGIWLSVHTINLPKDFKNCLILECSFYRILLIPFFSQQYPSIKEETLAFCEFIKNLDGSSIDNPEPTTLASLFAGTHEAQPPVSTPINVVELINLPYELRHSIKEPPKLLCDKHSLTDSESLPRITKSNAAKRQEKVIICSRLIRYYKITILR